jgi:Zn-dependent peptidase ImmA (M78 family)
MYDLLGHAGELKIDVIRRPLPTLHGLWIPDERIIVLRAGMSAHAEREVLAHEIGHAVAGHVGNSAANEAVADLYAASRLISRRDYEAAVLGTENLNEAARVLGVTSRMLYAFINASVAPAIAIAPTLLFRVADGCLEICNLV